MQAPQAELSTEKPVKNKWWLVVCVLLVLIIGVTTMSKLLSIQHDKYRYVETHYGVAIVDESSEQLSRQSRAVVLAKAELLRGKWRVWALPHRKMLVTLLNAKPTDQKALGHVYEAVPDWPGDGGVTGISVTDLHSGGTSFTWQPLAKRRTPLSNDPDQRLREAKADRSTAIHVQRSFTQFRDMELSQYQGMGMSTISLWVSGRITEKKYNLQHIPGKPSIVEGNPQEITPPYDFLVSSKKD